MKIKLTALPGDGIGPEVTREAIRVLQAVAKRRAFEVEVQERAIGGTAIRQFGTPLPQATLDTCLKSDAVLLGAVGGPEFDALPPDRRPEAGLLGLRRALGGFANLRPAVAYDAILDCSPLRADVARGADILFVRELLGGLYFAEPRGFAPDRSSAFNTMRYSVPEVERVARIAFALAKARRGKLTSVDKNNVLDTSQLWRQVVTAVSHDYPTVTLEHALVDSCAMRLVSAPTSFDVIVTENLFGDILTDEAAVITGSLGMLPSATLGGTVDLYEPVHGSAPDIAGKGIANPLGAIASVAMMLRHTAKLAEDAQQIEVAIRDVLNAGCRTADLARKGQASMGTQEMGTRVLEALGDVAERLHAYHAV